MIFEVTPDQITCLTSNQLVELLRRLLHAEAAHAGIPLRTVDVPLQITVPDGGEDARIEWQGGNPSTDYLPCRYTAFQAKATSPTPQKWKEEIWTKKSKKKAQKALSDAASAIVAKNGAYIGFCSHALSTPLKESRLSAIKEGFSEAGADPDSLGAIAIYDANKIASWVCQHPTAAVWLNELQSGLRFKGYSTRENWGKRTEISAVPLAKDTATRFAIGTDHKRRSAGAKESQENTFDSPTARKRILSFLEQGRRHVRIVGPSGIGKSRFVYETFSEDAANTLGLDKYSAIFCDYRDVRGDIAATLQSIASSRRPALLIIDECSHEEATHLHGVAVADESRVRLVTIGTELRIIENDSAMTISIGATEDSLIDAIIRSQIPNLGDVDLSYITRLCGGFPRIAVLAASSYQKNEPVIRSITDVAERILAGCNVRSPEQVRAIECLSLFKGIRADGKAAEDFDLVATVIARMTGDEMYEHIVRALDHQIVDLSGGAYSVQPKPLARYLGRRRLGLLRTATVQQFMQDAPEDTSLALLRRLRHFDDMPIVKEIGNWKLQRGGDLDNFEALTSSYGAAQIDALAHISPQAVLYTLERHFESADIDQLMGFTGGRGNVVNALARLAFRRVYFARAAKLLLRLAAAENDKFSNNATGHFTKFFQTWLSGTEAAPAERFDVIDQAINDKWVAALPVCIEGLAIGLRRSNFMRSSGAEFLGTQTPAKDWHPKLWKDVWDSHRSALDRLLKIRAAFPDLAGKCEHAIAENIRGLMVEPLFERVRDAALHIATTRGTWFEAVDGIGDWLFFDRPSKTDPFGAKVRQLYCDLLPSDLVDRALLYTMFWQGNIRDPDLIYREDQAQAGDYQYSSRMAQEVAEQLAKDTMRAKIAISTMSPMELNNVFPFAHRLGACSLESAELFNHAMRVYAANKTVTGLNLICGLLNGIEKTDPDCGRRCLEAALQAPALKDQHVNLYSAIPRSVERLKEITSRLRSGELVPRECVFLSYGRGLDGLPEDAVLGFVDAFIGVGTTDALWAALEVLSMHLHFVTDVPTAFADRICKIAVTPQLLDNVEGSSREAYHLENLVEKLARNGAISDEVAEGIASHIERLCRLDGMTAFFNFDSAMRKIIRALLPGNRAPVWNVVSSFYERATGLERFKIIELIGPQEDTFDSDHRHRAGLLYVEPTEQYVKWADADQEARSPFLCTFFPVLTDDLTSWHPEFEKIALRFGGIQEFRDAIMDRIIPNSWSGSIVPLLQVFVAPLETWSSQAVMPSLAVWARRAQDAINQRIEREDE